MGLAYLPIISVVEEGSMYTYSSPVECLGM